MGSIGLVAFIFSLIFKASKNCDEFYNQYSLQLNNLTMDKILEILGEEYFNKYKTEELDLE